MSAGVVAAVLAAYFVVEVASRGAILRTLYREVVRLFVLMELGATRLVRWAHPPRFVLLGECHKRGVCCRQIVGDPPRLIRETWALRLFLAWHRAAHRFHVVGRGPSGEIIFACGHLREDGRCGIYRYRPLLCRNYPVMPFFDPPSLLPGCGFNLAPRVVARMQKRTTLPIVNPFVAVHHPTAGDGPESESYELVEGQTMWNTGAWGCIVDADPAPLSRSEERT